MQLSDVTKHVNFIEKSHACQRYKHNCYACCACIKEQQVIVTVKFHDHVW